MLKHFRPWAPVLLIVASMGCFNYSELPKHDLGAGKDARITLNDAGRTALAPKIGTQVKWVSGHVSSVDTGGVTMSVARTHLLDGSEAPWNGEQVLIADQYIDQTQERTMSVSRTVGLLAILAGVTAAVALSIGLSTSGSVSSVPGSTAK